MKKGEKKIKAISADAHELIDRVYIVSEIIEAYINSHPAAKKNPAFKAEIGEALIHLASAYQIGGKKAPKKTKFQKQIAKVIDQLANAKYANGDSSDLGNEIGFALGAVLKNREELTGFLHGLNHGISLATGTH